jgi:hypothetical protein
MKTIMKTSIMLIAIIIGTLAASAQSADRGTPHNEPNRKSSKSSVEKQNRENTSSRQAESKILAERGTIHPGSNARVPEGTVNSNSRSYQKTSITNHNNPKSTYRAPNKKVAVNKTYLDPKQRTTYVNYSTNSAVNRNLNKNYSYSHYYPTKRVKMHVHPNMAHNHYRAIYYPSHRNIIWTSKMHRFYIGLYPGYTWHYPVGYHIQTMSVFDTRYNLGEVARVYGRVYGTWYNGETDDLLLFFGGEFPNQVFTMIVPGKIARRYHWRPEKYLLGQHIFATGLITSFEGKPEMVIKDKSQLNIY